MRMKEFGPRGGPRTWRPLGSANVKCLDVAAFWRPSSAIRAPGTGNVHLSRMHSSRMRTARFRGCLPGGVCPVGCVYLGGVCLGGVHPSPPVNRMTDSCKNITLPQTSFVGGNNVHNNCVAIHKMVPCK